MTDNTKSNELKKIYALLLSLKDELTRLSLEIRAVKSELKGVTKNG